MKFSPSFLWSERVLVADQANLASNEANTGFISRLQCLLLNGYNNYFGCVPGDQLCTSIDFRRKWLLDIFVSIQSKIN